jgi:hypothetical protein
MTTGAVFFAHKKRITERNSHLAGEASGSSISNGYQAKTERGRQLAGVGTGRVGTKLHVSVAGSRVTAFLATVAPWEPFITNNPRSNAYWEARKLLILENVYSSSLLLSHTNAVINLLTWIEGKKQINIHGLHKV